MDKSTGIKESFVKASVNFSENNIDSSNNFIVKLAHEHEIYDDIKKILLLSEYKELPENILEINRAIFGITNNQSSKYKAYFTYNPGHYTLAHLKRAFLLNGKRKDINRILRDIAGRANYDLAYLDKLLNDYPPALQIELSAVCNLRCPFCYQSKPHFRKTPEARNGYMDKYYFKEIIDEIAGKVPYIVIASRGEPTLHPQFEEFMCYLSGKFLDVKVNTNATLLDTHKLEALFKAADTVVISADSEDEKLYAEMRKGSTRSNLIKRLKLYQQVLSHHPRRDEIYTRISGVNFNEKNQDFAKFSAFYSDFCNDAVYVDYVPWENIYSMEKNEDAALTPCSELWTMMYIWSDGRYNCCDVDYMSNLVGEKLNAHESRYAVSNAWTSVNMNNLRETHLSGRRGELTPCNVCPN